MRKAARWGLVVVMCVVAFAVSWWVCQQGIRFDEAAALAVASAVLAVVLAIASWWAGRERQGGERAAQSADTANAGRWRLVQKARAGRDVSMAGRDQSVVNDRRRNE